MVDVALLQGAIAGLKAAEDIAAGLGKLHKTADVRGRAIELEQVIRSAQSSVLSAQAEQSALVQRVRLLEEEVAELRGARPAPAQRLSEPPSLDD